MRHIEYCSDDYEYFVDDYVHSGDYTENEVKKLSNIKVAVCKLDQDDERLEFLELFEGDIYNYQDEKVLLIDPNDNKKGFDVFEAITGKDVEEFIEYIEDMADVEYIDQQIYEVEVDLFLTSNEDIF